MLIAIEGVDKSGKETQANLLLERLLGENRNARKIEFPNYASEASGAVRMYLNGDFGTSPGDVNPYAASILFAVDRYASYKSDWGGFYNAGGIVVADRYTMSNMIHQGVKFSDACERRKYIDWLTDLEFIKIGLPEPDIVIFLDLPMDVRLRLLEKYSSDHGQREQNGQPVRGQALLDLPSITVEPIRRDKNQPQRGADIHERDPEYLRASHNCAQEIAEQLGWLRVNACKDGALRPAADIHDEIYKSVVPLL